MVVAVCTTISTSSLAQSHGDFWKTCMEAAVGARDIADFGASASLLRVAIAAADARQSDDRLRKTPSTIALILAYEEVNRSDLVEETSSRAKFKIGPPVPKEFGTYVTMLDDLGWSFYNRWKEINATPHPDGHQGDRLQASAYLFQIELFLRDAVLPNDNDGQFSAETAYAIVLEHRDDFDESGRYFDLAAQLVTKGQNQFSGMASTSRLFTVGREDGRSIANGVSNSDDTFSGLLDNQFLISYRMADHFDLAATKNIKKQNYVLAMKQIEDGLGLDAQALRIYNAPMMKWDNNPFIGRIYVTIASLRKTQFDLDRMHKGSFPGAFQRAKVAYGVAYCIYRHANGPQDPWVNQIRDDYAELVRSAGRDGQEPPLESSCRTKRG